MACLFLRLFLLVFCNLLYFHSTEALIAPRNVSCHIVKDAVEVSWEHSQSDRSLGGYYIIVREVSSGRKGNPAYVHVKSGTRRAQVRGLRPGTLYQFKVAVFLENTHKTSSPVTINTNSLEFFLAHHLNVSKITNTSATFMWTHTAENNVHHIKFKLLCSGMQIFTKAGVQMEEESWFEYESWSTSQGSESYMTTALVPNSHYTCHIVSMAGNRQSSTKLAPQIVFQTARGRPSNPPRPRISVADVGEHATLSMELYPSDDQCGPIDLYKVILVPVSKDNVHLQSAPYQPVVPLTELMAHAVSKELAAQATKPVPFILGEYTANEFPHLVDFTIKTVRKDFKPDTYYSVVVAAIANITVDAEPLYSLSSLADIPVFIGPDLEHEWVVKKKPMVARFTTTVLSTMFSVVGISAIALIILFVVMYVTGRKRDVYHFSVNEEDSSSDEDAIFIKKPLPPGASMAMEEVKKFQARKDRNKLLKNHTPIPPRPEGQSKADWAVKNIGYNPVFEDTVYRGADTMKEMEATMALIAERRLGKSPDKAAMQREPPDSQDTEKADLPSQLSSAATQSVATQETSVPHLLSPHIFPPSSTSLLSQSTSPLMTPSVSLLTYSAEPSQQDTSKASPPPYGDRPPAPLPGEKLRIYQTPPSEEDLLFTSHNSFQPYRSSNQKFDPPKMEGEKIGVQHSSNLPSYFYTTTKPAPGVSLEEYNITTSASPLSTVHRVHSSPPSHTQK